MTFAAEDMALGRYDHEIEARGDDEVGRLSAAFNMMMREVARSQRTLRDFVANVSHDLADAADLDPGLLAGDGGRCAAEPGGLRRGRPGHQRGGRADAAPRRGSAGAEQDRVWARSSLDLEPCELEMLAHQAAERAERRADERGVGLALAIDEAPVVRADGRWVERAVDNLLDNALKHTPAGGTDDDRDRHDDGTARLAGDVASRPTHAEDSAILPSTTPARSSRRAISPGCSSASISLTRPAPPLVAAAALDWPSHRRSCRHTVAGFTSRARWPVGQSSPFCCRCLTGHSGRGVGSLRSDRENVS